MSTGWVGSGQTFVNYGGLDDWGGVRGEGIPSPSDYEVWESVVNSPSGIRRGAPVLNAFWRILKAKERPWYRPNCLQLHTVSESS